MNLSLKWLKDYVDISGISNKQYSDRMTMTGSKVEGFATENDGVINVVVGQIKAIEKHPNADKLVVCQIDVGRDETVQIVTGATNVNVGDMVPCALDMSILPNKTKIKKGKLRGVESCGMLCSLGELNLTKNDFPYAIEDGIFIMQEDCKVGDNLCDAIGLNDTTVEFEITSNRPDCLSVIGLARETAASFNLPLTVRTPVVKGDCNGGCGSIDDMLTVKVLNKTDCMRYIARVVKNVKVTASPRWMRERLRASGVRPINNIVDITNYVMLEYGQPMHGFDYENITDRTIVVRDANPDETIMTLDGTERKLDPSMLVIADSAKAIAVAGVMGGEYSSITDSTTTIVFESAAFMGSSVRKTSKALGLRTDSSSRFEKGLDPEGAYLAIERACQLIEELGCGEVVGGMIDEQSFDNTRTKLELSHEWINSFVGFSLSKQEMIDILEKLGFTVDGDIVTVPLYRADVQHKADLAEEIARIYGYDKIPTTAVRGIADGRVTKPQTFDSQVDEIMQSLGCYEVMTYSFVSPKVFDKINLPQDHILRNALKIMNPLGEDTSIMRTTTIPSMMEVLSRNYNNRNPYMWGYEIGTEYIKQEDDSLPYENRQLTIGLYENNADFFLLKGMVEALLDGLNVKDYDFVAVSDNQTFHPGQTAMVVKGDIVLGIIGQIHPIAVKRYDIGCKVFMAKLSMDALYCAASSDKQYTPLPKFPSTTRDLSLLCDVDIPVSTITAVIKKAVGHILETVTLFDLYQGDKIEAGKKSVAFSIVMRSPSATLTDDEVNKAIDKVLSSLAKINVELRR